jgi:lysozyme
MMTNEEKAMIKTPKMTRPEIETLLTLNGVDLAARRVVIVGIRGYYKNTMGAPGVNDRGIYDDAIFVISAAGGDGSPGEFRGFQANTDPSVRRSGIATLLPGLYDVVKWRHHGKYAALQIVNDRLERDGRAGVDAGRHGINFHYGGSANTGSEGCQTMTKADFLAFQPLVYRLMDRHAMSIVRYLLVEE